MSSIVINDLQTFLLNALCSVKDPLGGLSGKIIGSTGEETILSKPIHGYAIFRKNQIMSNMVKKDN